TGQGTWHQSRGQLTATLPSLMMNRASRIDTTVKSHWSGLGPPSTYTPWYIRLGFNVVMQLEIYDQIIEWSFRNLWITVT
ncbi:hypothetical protein WA026_005006, partial [Henosepilachna vigintioctopunctata]